MSDHVQFDHIHNYLSEHKPVSHGFTQGFVLGPVLFNIRVISCNIIRKYNANFISVQMIPS